jgi:hypothetical protein
MRILFAVICCAFLLSCGSDDGGDEPVITVCPTVALAGFDVQITNTDTGLPLSNVTITARESNTFEEVLAEVSTSPGTYQGVFEREGSYALVITLTDFQTIVTETFPIGRFDDECDTLDTQELSFSLSEL